VAGEMKQLRLTRVQPGFTPSHPLPDFLAQRM
jgi:hypothetical protein